MAFEIKYKASVARDLKNIGKHNAGRIVNDFEKSLRGGRNSGAPLKGQFKGLFKYRVGEYRVIYTLIEDGIIVLRIAHRSRAYQGKT